MNNNILIFILIQIFKYTQMFKCKYTNNVIIHYSLELIYHELS